WRRSTGPACPPPGVRRPGRAWSRGRRRRGECASSAGSADDAGSGRQTETNPQAWSPFRGKQVARSDYRLAGDRRKAGASDIAVVGHSEPALDLLVDVRHRGDGHAQSDAVPLLEAAGGDQPTHRWRVAQGQTEIEARSRRGLDLGEDMFAV